MIFNINGKTPAQMLQPAMKYTDIAATPQEFMKKLDKAEFTPVKDTKRPEVVAIVKFKK